MKGPVSTTWKLLCPDKSGALMLQFQTDGAPALAIWPPLAVHRKQFPFTHHLTHSW